MKSKAIIFILTVFLSGCNIADELCAADAITEKNNLWAFMHFNVPEEGGKIESYYYFGKISESLYEKINTNAISTGFMHLEEVRYWGEDDLVHEYKDNEYSGDLLFRVEHLVRVKVLNMDPLLGFKDSIQEDIAPILESENESPKEVL